MNATSKTTKDDDEQAREQRRKEATFAAAKAECARLWFWHLATSNERVLLRGKDDIAFRSIEQNGTVRNALYRRLQKDGYIDEQHRLTAKAASEIASVKPDLAGRIPVGRSTFDWQHEGCPGVHFLETRIVSPADEKRLREAGRLDAIPLSLAEIAYICEHAADYEFGVWSHFQREKFEQQAFGALSCDRSSSEVWLVRDADYKAKARAERFAARVRESRGRNIGWGLAQLGIITGAKAALEEVEDPTEGTSMGQDPALWAEKIADRMKGLKAQIEHCTKVLAKLEELDAKVVEWSCATASDDPPPTEEQRKIAWETFGARYDGLLRNALAEQDAKGKEPS